MNKPKWTKTHRVARIGLVKFDDPRIFEKPSVDEVALAMEFLEYCSHSKRVTKNSYTLKHDAERFAEGLYVSNGALIQAAVDLGFRVEPAGDGINARVFVKGNYLSNITGSYRLVDGRAS